MEVVRELVPPKARKIIYAAYILAGLIIGSCAVIGGMEIWTEPAERVMAYLAVPLAVLAGVNVNGEGAYQARRSFDADFDDDPIGALTDCKKGGQRGPHRVGRTPRIPPILGGSDDTCGCPRRPLDGARL